MRAVVEFDREEWAKLNTCKFCVGSHLHSCTGYDCKEAVKKAEEYFEKTARRNRTMDDIKRGEIFYIARGATSGSEQFADRPAVVVSNDENNKHSGVIEVAYLTTAPKTDLPTHVTIRSTGRTSTVLCEQVTSVSVDRVNKYIGQVSEQEMKNIDIALMISLAIGEDTKS